MNKCGFTKDHSAHFLPECSAPSDLFSLDQSVAIAKLCLLQKNLASKHVLRTYEDQINDRGANEQRSSK